MRITTEANSSMLKYLVLQKDNNENLENLEKIVCSELDFQYYKIKINEEKGQVWLSDKESPKKYKEIIRDYTTLSLFEWEEFELYFDGNVVKEKAGSIIQLLISYFGIKIVKKLEIDKIDMCIWIQEDDWFNIKAKFHISRCGEKCVEDIDGIPEPTLIIHYNCS